LPINPTHDIISISTVFIIALSSSGSTSLKSPNMNSHKTSRVEQEQLNTFLKTITNPMSFSNVFVRKRGEYVASADIHSIIELPNSATASAMN
tara:strand:- start:1099 stop:1377 length:279 start_codon:yes stop_codon:yes gene_type:complete